MRVIDTPITEHGFAGLGIGAAIAGLEADRRVHDLQFRHAGDGPADQFGGQDALHVGRPDGLLDGVPRAERRRRRGSPPSTARTIPSWYSHIPGLKVIAPYTAADAKGLLKAAIRDPNPVIFLENEILYGQSFPVPKLDDYVVPIGKAKIVRPGNDVTIVAWSIGMTYALKAADELAKDNIEAEVIDLRTLKPMDTETIVEFGEEDRPHRHGRGGLAAVGRRRRDRGAA